MNKSTSIFNINADKGLNKWQMRAYKLSNIFNNSFPNIFIDKTLKIKNFTINNMEKYIPLLTIQSSPSRKLSDLFWINLPWKEVKNELKEINLLDIGCGSGNYLENFIKWSQNSINNYLGLDISPHENWSKLLSKYNFANFKVADSNNIKDIIPSNTNMIVSQSAIEHFGEDITFFKQIRKFIANNKKPFIQIHIFPSASCLELYKYHGFRQYTPRTISKITRLFRNFSESTLYNLGGDNSNEVHNKFITKPKYTIKQDLRKTKTFEYEEEAISAIKKDMLEKNVKNPSFYALVIKSNL